MTQYQYRSIINTDKGKGGEIKMEILNMIIKEMNRVSKEEKRAEERRQREHEKEIARINRQAKQPTLRTQVKEDPIKLEKLKKFLAKHKVERVGL